MSAQSHPTKRKIHKVDCSQCKGTLTIRAVGHVNTLVCEFCGADYKVEPDGKLALREAFKLNKRFEKANPKIPLGSMGELHGAKWEVIGYLKRVAKNGSFHWEEYLLFNPYKGYRWLTCNDGHWNYVCVLHSVPKYVANGYRYLGRKYTTWEKYKAYNKSVAGEFNWEVKLGRVSDFEDYVNTPSMLTRELLHTQTYHSKEIVETFKVNSPLSTEDLMPVSSIPQNQRTLFPKSHSTVTDFGKKTNIPIKKEPRALDYVNKPIEEVWSISEYIERQDVIDAFKLDAKLIPKPAYIAGHQPFKLQSHIKPMVVVFMAFLGLMMLSEMMLSNLTSPQLIIQDQFSTGQPVGERNTLSTRYFKHTYVSPSFEMTSSRGLVNMSYNTDVSNSWVEIDASLVNEQTGDTFYFFNSIEYYYGVDYDGRWSEGSQNQSTEFSRLPPGQYHLQMEIETNRPDTTIRYRLVEGTQSGFNFGIALLLGALPLCYVLIRKYLFETIKSSDNED